MGLAKAEMMRLEALEGVATGVALQAGALQTCPLHDEIVLTSDSPDGDRKTYALGTIMVKNGTIDGTREEFMAAIKSAIENASEECWICAKRLDE